MSNEASHRTKILGAILIVLVIAVLIQFIFLVRMNHQIMEMVKSNVKRSEPSLTLPDHKNKSAGQPKMKVLPDFDNWPNDSFDPDTWNPFEEMQRMHDRMERMFDRAFGRFRKTPRFKPFARERSFMPKLDINEDKDKFVIRVDLPGVEKSDIKVEVKNQVVTITGKRRELFEESDKKGNVLRRERRTGQFERRVELPEPVDVAKMKIKQEKGILTIILPKVKN